LGDLVSQVKSFVGEYEGLVEDASRRQLERLIATADVALANNDAREAQRVHEAIRAELEGAGVSFGTFAPKKSLDEATKVLQADLSEHSGDAARDRAPERAGKDPVECSVYAVPEARRGDDVLVQVFAHLPEKRDEARREAIEADPEATRRARRTLEVQISRHEVLTFELQTNGADVDEPIVHLTWHGETASVQFDVHVPETFAKNHLGGKLIVSCDGTPVGRLSFKVVLRDSSETLVPRRAQPGSARRFDKAFVSYASEDRAEVLKRVQMLDAMKYDYFQDILKLDPGSRWEHELYKHIDDSDVVFLFWSSAARDSKWVLKEVRYALARRGDDCESPPDIIPIMLEGPPPPLPPPDLGPIHFADRLIYFIKVESENRKAIASS
jgi:hypothetical protein